jgi:hypothetical protein
LLEAGAEKEEDLPKFSKRIIDAIHEMLTSDLKGRSEFPEVGTAFKSSVTTAVHWVAWRRNSDVWITTATDSYGWLASVDDPFFNTISPSSARTGRPGSNKDWAVGDRVTAFQGAWRGVVLAVHDRGVLLDGPRHLEVASNYEMSRHYKKEK